MPGRFRTGLSLLEVARDCLGRVRAHWVGYLAQPPGHCLKAKIDGVSIVVALFTPVYEVQEGGQLIAAVFAEWVETAR